MKDQLMNNQSLSSALTSSFSYRILYKRVKYPRITIKPNLEILISVPFFFTLIEVYSLIDRHQDWINKTLIKLIREDSFLELQKHKSDEILFFGDWVSLSSLSANPKSYLKNQLQKYLFSQVAYYSRRMGLKFEEIRVTNALSRFGSCTHDNRLFFSFMLVFAPKDLITYVVIHELAHIPHKNHSKAFWNLVQFYCPNYKFLRISLQKRARIYPELIHRLES